MCELFGMSARQATTVTLSLEEFSRHGGLTGPHKDGWGIAWYEDGDLREVREREPAADSACVRFIRSSPFTSALVLSHVRKATQGSVSTRNCQPFSRELGGRWHCFAHNGHLGAIADIAGFGTRRFRPVGETDSEIAFCALLESLSPLWDADAPPTLESRIPAVTAFAARLRPLGPANFLYCDGDALFAHADRRTHPDGAIRPPGLWRLTRQCAAQPPLDADGLSIGPAAEGQRVTLFASVPLTAESWEPMASGELCVALAGERIVPAARAPQSDS